jgi:hypothetical protein
MIPYVKLNNDTYTLIVKGQPYHVSRSSSFHFKRIIQSIESATENELLELLTVDPNQRDLYKLYVGLNDESVWLLSHHKSNGDKSKIASSHNYKKKSPLKLVGVFPSKEDVEYDYPELFL